MVLPPAVSTKSYTLRFSPASTKSYTRDLFYYTLRALIELDREEPTPYSPTFWPALCHQMQTVYLGEPRILEAGAEFLAVSADVIEPVQEDLLLETIGAIMGNYRVDDGTQFGAPARPELQRACCAALASFADAGFSGAGFDK